MGPWAYGVLEGRQVDQWLASRAGWRADVLRDRTQKFKNSKFQIFKNSKIHIFKNSNFQIFKNSNFQIFKFSKI